MNALSPSRTLSSHCSTIWARASALVGWSWTCPCAARIPNASRGVSVAELGECVAFDWVAVAAVLGEADRVGPSGEGGEDAAGVDRGKLVVVTDQDDLGVGAAGVVDEPCELAGADHGGFVDHHDRAAGEAGLGVAVERAEEAVQAARRDPGIGLELGGGAGGEGASDDRVAVAFPHLPGDGQRVGLAGTGGTDDHRHTRPAGRERDDHRRLLVTQRRRVLEDRSEVGAHAVAAVTACFDGVEDVAFEREVLDGRVLHTRQRDTDRFDMATREERCRRALRPVGWSRRVVNGSLPVGARLAGRRCCRRC